MTRTPDLSRAFSARLRPGLLKVPPLRVLVQRESYKWALRLSNFYDGFSQAWAASLEKLVGGRSIASRPSSGCRFSVEAATGYPLTGCSPAEPVSVSPVGLILAQAVDGIKASCVVTGAIAL